MWDPVSLRGTGEAVAPPGGAHRTNDTDLLSWRIRRKNVEQNNCKWFYSFGKFKLKRNSKTSTEFSTEALRFAIEIQHLQTIGVEKQHAILKLWVVPGLVLKFCLRLENWYCWQREPQQVWLVILCFQPINCQKRSVGAHRDKCGSWRLSPNTRPTPHFRSLIYKYQYAVSTSSRK